MKTKINKLLIIAVAAVMLFSFSSCKKDSNNVDELNARLSFVNTVEGSAAQDVYINDSKASATAVAYGSSTTDISTSSGNKLIAFKNTGSSTVSASATINAEANTSQTAFLIKQADGNLAVSTYANDNTSASGKVKVRFINVAPLLVGAVNVITNTGTNLVSTLAFRAASAYQTIDANTNLNVNVSGSVEVVTIAGSELQAGKIYTIWFDNSSTTRVKYHVILQN